MDSLDELVDLVERSDIPLYVRSSSDLDGDRSVDHDSGPELPGMSVNPLDPPAWWQGPPVAGWVTRQVRSYQHLKEADDDRRCWVVTGAIVDRGPDNEPLLTGVEVVGLLADALVDACGAAQSDLSRREDGPEEDGSAPWQA